MRRPKKLAHLCYTDCMAVAKHDMLDEVVNRLAREFSPEKIWLFGSHSCGAPDAGSDLDLLVVVPESAESPARRAQRAQRCLSDIPVAADVLVRTRHEFDALTKIPASLETAIMKRGNPVYG